MQTPGLDGWPPLQGLPVLDACDADVSKLCLGDKGLSTLRVGEIRRCLIGFVAPQSPPESDQVGQDYQDCQTFSHLFGGEIPRKANPSAGPEHKASGSTQIYTIYYNKGLGQLVQENLLLALKAVQLHRIGHALP